MYSTPMLSNSMRSLRLLAIAIVLSTCVAQPQSASLHVDPFPVSSRFSEYVFQYARMHENNSPCFSVSAFRRHLRHFIGQIKLAANGGLELPPSKRGVPNKDQPNLT